MLTLPTILTIGRLIMLPFLVWALIAGHYWLALGLYVVGAVTDWLDGWIARKYDQVSEFGTFLDPISDKIFVCTLFITLIAIRHVGTLGFTAMLIILAREFLVSGLREYLGPKNVKLPVSTLGKWKTTAQMLATGILILVPVVPFASEAGLILLLVAAGLTCASGWLYLKLGLEKMRQIK